MNTKTKLLIGGGIVGLLALLFMSKSKEPSTPTLCNDGEVENQVYCSDGVTLKSWDQCVNGKFESKTQSCPTFCFPKPSIFISSSDADYWESCGDFADNPCVSLDVFVSGLNFCENYPITGYVRIESDTGYIDSKNFVLTKIDTTSSITFDFSVLGINQGVHNIKIELYMLDLDTNDYVLVKTKDEDYEV